MGNATIFLIIFLTFQDAVDTTVANSMFNTNVYMSGEEER